VKFSDFLEKILKTYSNQLDNLKGMHNFLDTHDLPKLNQEDINNINRLTSNHEIEISRNSPQQRKAYLKCKKG
jgi:hypothetical protein